MDQKKSKRVRASETPILTKSDASELKNKEENLNNSTKVEKESDTFSTGNGYNDNSSEDCEIDEDLIYAGNVSDRRLFYDAADGDLQKYKLSVELDDPTLPNQVWVGVTGKSCSIKHYITIKDQNGKVSTIFLDHMNRNIVKTAFASFLQHGDPNQLWKKDLLPHPLHFSTEDDCLIIGHTFNHLWSVMLTKDTINQFYEKEWELERFIKYLHNKHELIRYGENILSDCTSKRISRQEFGRRWVKPPNRSLSLDDVWIFLKKKYLGYKVW